jgi:hypothetical protein
VERVGMVAVHFDAIHEGEILVHYVFSEGARSPGF